MKKIKKAVSHFNICQIANLKECAWDSVLGGAISVESTTSRILLHRLVLFTTVEFTDTSRRRKKRKRESESQSERQLE